MAAKKKAKKVVKKAAVKKGEGKKEPPASFDQLDSLLCGLTETGTTSADVTGYLHTGSRALDWALTNGRFLGGYPQGRLVEFYGAAAAGKTSAAVHALIAAQKGDGVLVDWVIADSGIVSPQPSDRKMLPGLSILIDSEAKFDIGRATMMGLDIRKLHRIEGNVGSPLTVESMIESLSQILDKVESIPDFQTGQRPVVIVVDSISAAATDDEMAGNALAGGIASKPRTVRAALRKLTGRFSSLNVTCIMISHVSANIGSVGSTPSGSGKALAFFAALRFNFKKGYKGSQALDLMISGHQVGITTAMQMTKSSTSVPIVTPFNVPNVWATGFHQGWEVIKFLRDTPNNVLTNNVAWSKIKVCGKESSHMEKDLLQLMSTDESVITALFAEFDRLNSSAAADVLPDEVEAETPE
jgi:RecA/RadA recombinase